MPGVHWPVTLAKVTSFRVTEIEKRQKETGETSHQPQMAFFPREGSVMNTEV